MQSTERRRTVISAFLVTVIVLITVCACLQVELTTGSALHGHTTVPDATSLYTEAAAAVEVLIALLPPRAVAVISVLRTEAAWVAGLVESR